ncbi:MAG: bacteriophage T4 gp5 trimerization domain-containing protein, partial [Limisphaerales bacterium]
FEQVGNKRHEIVDGDHLEKIKGDRNLAVAGKEAIRVAGSHSVTIEGDVIEVFKANHSEKISNDFYLKADNIVIEADTNITIKVGSSHIAIEASGIKIGTSGQLKVEATGPLKVESKSTADIDATQTSVKGKAMVQLQGAIVKIN